MSHRSRRPIRIAIAIAIVCLSALPGTATAAVDSPTSSNVAAPLSAPIDETGVTFHGFRSNGYPLVPGSAFWLEARTTVPAGPVHFAEVIDGSPSDLGEVSWADGGTVNGVQIRLADLSVPGPSAGEHHYQAIIDATDTTDALTIDLTLEFEPVPLTITITTATNPLPMNHAAILYAELAGEGTGTAYTGTIEWRDVDTDVVLATRSVDDPNLTLGPLPIGFKHLVAAYSGDIDHGPAISPTFTLTVAADSVDATGVGLQYTTFYPTKDGYRDTLAIRGMRAEAISVGIRIYGPTGSLVRAASVPGGTGAYSWLWNGRTSTGVTLANARYKVVQTLSDAAGTKRVVSAFVNLSSKRLVTHSAYVTKTGSAISVHGVGGNGKVTVSTSGRYSKLTAGSGWAIAGWEFVLPSATVYRSVTFQVDAKSPLSVPPTYLGMQNFTTCARVAGTWYDTCFDRWKAIGNATGARAWFSTATTAAADRSGRYVRGIVDVSSGTTTVYGARLLVVYQTLQ